MFRRKNNGCCGCISIVFLVLIIAALIATYWPIALVAVVVVIIVAIIRNKRIRKSPFWNVNFDIMSGLEFEHFCSELLKANGFANVRVTQGSGDHGIDITANKGGERYAIQCKCYSKNVGNKAVQEAYSGKDIYRLDIAVVMTNRFFTKQATEDARRLGVELWDRNELMKLVRQAKGEDENE